ncbi:uncharacterized protein LOC21412250 [Morus notabilis]|uniref:uncharacterized protein LOC21412250 n=1 Tax=Morus notabilis TaxID=981085 RepID=UPI000CED6A12|nr:uncharacterized protein LOC21412250 [Morus notabilis]
MDQTIQHWSHQQHPLLLIRKDDQQGQPTSFTCGICKQWAEAYTYYACDPCKFYVHKSCAELPHQINHPFHPSHGLLTLCVRENFYCYSCHQSFTNTLCFTCGQCNFKMDLACALMPPISCEDQDHIQHFTHQHPMPLVKADDNCFVCHLTCSSLTAYGCTKCKHFLHKSCAELPLEIQHSVHPNHGLLTLVVTHDYFTCSLCEKRDRQTLFFKCHSCSFQLCVKCGTTVKGINSIRYQDHEHLLCFLEENPYTELGPCNGYDAYCRHPVLSNSIELSHTQCSIFHCLDCDFKVHLLCGPLPSIIKFKYHVDPLILVDSFEEDDSGEYYCDVCESERDPRIRIYYCQECKFFAHVHCLISEIVNVLKGDLTAVELKTCGTNLWISEEMNVGEEEQAKSSMTFKELLDKIPGHELSWFKVDFEWDTSSHDQENKQGQGVSSQRTSDQLDLRDEYIDELLRLSRFTADDFSSFSYSLRRNFYRRKLKINVSDLALKIVEVKGYKVPFTLAPVLKILLRKTDEGIFRFSESSTEMKSIAVSFLCKVVKQLRSTMVQDITHDLLQDWYFYVEFAYWRVDFEVDFLKQSLQKITKAFFNSQLKKLQVDVPKTIKQKLDDFKNKLEKCEKFLETSPDPTFTKACLDEAAKLEWKTASEFLKLS